MEAFEISIVENVQRKTLSPIDEARAFKKYVCDNGWGSISELASKLGKSVAYITKRIMLLDLPSDVTKAINEIYLYLVLLRNFSPLKKKMKHHS